jgi:hypothetical protein
MNRMVANTVMLLRHGRQSMNRSAET